MRLRALGLPDAAATAGCRAILDAVDTAQPVVLIALGSNIEPEENLPRAVELLALDIEIVAASAVYACPPIGAPGTPEFLNAVLSVRTRRGPRGLKFAILRAVESRLGRRRGSDRNAPRTIDLDLVLFGDRVEMASDLVLPDPALLTEAHVAVPAADVAGDVLHPEAHVTISQIASGIESRLSARADVILVPSGHN